MKEPDLSKAIDQAAQQRAKMILNDIKRAVEVAVNGYFRPKQAGGEWIGDELRSVLEQMAKSAEWPQMKLHPPTRHLVDGCRAAIVNDLLTGLPKIQELMALSMQYMEESERGDE